MISSHNYHLVVVFDERELLRLKELGLGDVQAVLSVKKLDHTSIAVSHSQIVLDHETLEMLDHTPGAPNDSMCHYTVNLNTTISFQSESDLPLQITRATGFDCSVHKTFTTSHTMEKELLKQRNKIKKKILNE